MRFSTTSKSMSAIRLAQKQNISSIVSKNCSIKVNNNVKRLDGIARRISTQSSTTTATTRNSTAKNQSKNIICNSSRSISSTCTKAMINSSPLNNSNDGNNNIITSATALTAILAAAIFQEYPNKKDRNNVIQCDAVGQAVGIANPFKKEQQSKKQKHQPRNVMIHRMRSIRARHLGEKYKVDWNTCLGEGAYAQVFPARSTSATGEKVCFFL